MNNGGLVTEIWGPPMWDSLHAITFGFPSNPTIEQRRNYLDYLRSLGDVLPCSHCKKSNKDVSSSGPAKLCWEVTRSRHTLTKWAFDLHCEINKRLHVTYDVSYDKVCHKYEGYRAKCSKFNCSAPVDKTVCYELADTCDAPVSDFCHYDVLSEYARSLGLVRFKEFSNFYSDLPRDSLQWNTRNVLSKKLLKIMRKTGIPPLLNGLPTVWEMCLLSILCSRLNNDQLSVTCDNIKKHLITQMQV